MKFAFVFPGQGSQSVGMLDAFAGHAAFRAVVRETLDEASDALGQNLGKLIAEGPAGELNLTTNTQPVMLSAAYAVYRAWQQAGGPAPAIVAGHSLGEYTALVVAGALAFRDAVPLVRFRAQAMQEAVPVGEGGMAAILGLDDDAVRAVCAQASAEVADAAGGAGSGLNGGSSGGSNSGLDSGSNSVVEAVNFNAPAQVVIAGHKAAVEKACEIARAKGAKRALPLPVSAPFHSSLLKPASARLREYLTDVTLRVPTIPVVNNIDVAIESDPAAIRDALVRQAAGPVRWVECVQAIAAQGATHLLECGPGKVLAGLTKRIDGNLGGVSVADPASLDEALRLVNA